MSAAPDALPAPAPTAAAAPAVAEWMVQGEVHTLRLAGDWQDAPAQLPSPPAEARQLAVDARDLSGWDARLASALWQWLSAIPPDAPRPDLSSLPPGLQQILSLSLPEETPAAAAKPAGKVRPQWVVRLGEQARSWWRDARLTLEFVGELLQSVGRLLRGRSDLRWSDLAWQLDQTGPRSVPIVVLVSLMVGLILAYMGAAQLARFGAKTFVADLMTVSVVREIAALLTGIILSGRVGAAFAAQLGSMRANDELDALRTLGIQPMDHLVLPRVLALMLVAPLLTAISAAMGLLVGWAAAVGIYSVGSAEYVTKSMQALTGAHLAVGLLKGSVYGALVALAGCRQGLHAGRSAQAVGDATTQAVVKSIVWIVSAASVLTIIFQRMDI